MCVDENQQKAENKSLISGCPKLPVMRYFLFFVLLLHGLIHLLGFAKAFSLAPVEQLQLPISKSSGLLWLIASLLLVLTAILQFRASSSWPLWAFGAIAISQILILLAWQDAKWGTIANLIILVAATVAFSGYRFEKSFLLDVKEQLSKPIAPVELLTLADLAPLPTPVQRYVQYVGAIGQPKVHNMVVTFRGRMRSKDQEWFHFTSRQFNDFSDPARLFFMKAKVKGLSTYGYHAYQDQQAAMLIKILSLVPVVDLGSEELFRTETVTFFNDMCLLAPAALIDPRIQWEPIDSASCRAIFTNQNTSITATLYFDEEGKLLNFRSDDRKEINVDEYLPFSTPVSSYQSFGAADQFRLIGDGQAVWHYPDGAFAYGEFHTVEVRYNVGDKSGLISRMPG